MCHFHIFCGRYYVAEIFSIYYLSFGFAMHLSKIYFIFIINSKLSIR